MNEMDRQIHAPPTHRTAQHRPVGSTLQTARLCDKQLMHSVINYIQQRGYDGRASLESNKEDTRASKRQAQGGRGGITDGEGKQSEITDDGSEGC